MTSNVKSLPKGTQVPDHIAVILDGNGRWARSRGLRVTAGHEAGAKAIKQVLEASRELGVHTLTLWGFSTENWSRPPAEVKKILSIVKHILKREFATFERDNVRFVHLGRKDRLPNGLLKMIVKAEEETKHNTKYLLNLALDYGGRDEILRATKKLIEDGVVPEDLDEKLFSSYLDTHDQPYPYPDLFIRTSGEQRTSGLLPWQMVYTEFYFEPDHLPDMSPKKLRAAIMDYSRRRRRFGGKDKMAHFRFKPEVVAGLELNWWRLENIPEGTTFRKYAMQHVREQWGLSVVHATKAAAYLASAMLLGRKNKWDEAGREFGKFYKVVKEEVKLAFEPSVAASFEVKLLRGDDNPEYTMRSQISEVYRISEFQAAKAAHLRALATRERALAYEHPVDSELHWGKAEDYLQRYYSALKDRVA